MIRELVECVGAFASLDLEASPGQALVAELVVSELSTGKRGACPGGLARGAPGRPQLSSVDKLVTVGDG